MSISIEGTTAEGILSESVCFGDNDMSVRLTQGTKVVSPAGDVGNRGSYAHVGAGDIGPLYTFHSISL